MNVIAHIRSDFPSKFGIPRQSGLIKELQAKIIFTKDYRNADALRGLENFSHLWLLWYFSEAARADWSPTVRPPRLGGNIRMGVFATRSPYRPNPIGLSAVKLEHIEISHTDGPLIYVSGADLMDNTPILDIKPYLPYADAYPQATGGFTDRVSFTGLKVNLPQALQSKVPPDKLAALTAVLQNDPRPSYQNDPERVYGFFFTHLEIKFRVTDSLLTVLSIEKA